MTDTSNRGAPVVGILHPGSMGAAIAAQARVHAATVLWCPQGRSTATARRAAAMGLTSVDDLPTLASRCDVLVSICPPAAAEDVARDIVRTSFTGLFVDANAISPQRAIHISRMVCQAGATFLDAAVIGSPPSTTKTTRVYVAGDPDSITRVSRIFDGTAVDVYPLGRETGKASALKMAYSSYQKVSRVLAAIAVDVASDYGVSDELLDIAAQRLGSYLTETDYAAKTYARAWRWAPELKEVADTLQAVERPADLARAAADVLARWASEGRDEMGTTA